MKGKEKVIEILVRGVCVKGGKLLVCQSKGARNTYLPGGHVEWGEQADASLGREIAEELGVNARVGAFLGAVEHTYVQKGARIYEVNLVFRMDIPGLQPGHDPAACESWISFRWIPLSGLGRNFLEPWPLRRLVPQWTGGRALRSRWGSTL